MRLSSLHKLESWFGMQKNKEREYISQEQINSRS
jgi:hypothetical protein